MATRDDDTRTLLERATDGDDRAVDKLMAEHLPGLRRFVSRRMGQLAKARETPSDVVQSACREALTHLDRFKYDGDDGFRRWLYTTALRKIQDHHRYWTAQKRDAARDVALEGERASDPRVREFLKTMNTPSRHVSLQEELARLEAVFDELPPRYRDVILFAHVEGLPHAEIAERLGTTESHSRVILSRALARLARLVRRGESED